MPRTSDSHFTVICGCVLSLVLNDWSETECLRVNLTVVSKNLLHSPKLSLLLLLLLEKTNLSCSMQASRTGYKVNKTVQ